MPSLTSLPFSSSTLAVPPSPLRSSSLSSVAVSLRPTLSLHSSLPFSDDHRRRRCSRSPNLQPERRCSTDVRRFNASASAPVTSLLIAAAGKEDTLKVIISGAPATGKGTQCEFIKNKYGLVHISPGDLLRAEIDAGSVNGDCAREYMEKGLLAPDEIVVLMVKERLQQHDVEENGWLLDGYPRSLSQAKALEDIGIRPDIFIFLDVREEIVIDRVIGRRLDPVTGKIYHLKYSPPENQEIAARLTQRFDDTEEKVKLRLQTHYQNVDGVLSIYKDIIVKVDGNGTKEDVFTDIENALSLDPFSVPCYG